MGKEGICVKSKELVKRYALFVTSLFFSALGVAFTKTGGLGVSPVSSVANVLSLRFPGVSMGQWLILWSAVLILGQILVLRRRYQPIQLLQLPMAVLFGWFTDFGMWLISWFTADTYPMRVLMVVIGTIVLGFGVSAVEPIRKNPIPCQVGQNLHRVKVCPDLIQQRQNALLGVLAPLAVTLYREPQQVAAILANIMAAVYIQPPGGLVHSALNLQVYRAALIIMKHSAETAVPAQLFGSVAAPKHARAFKIQFFHFYTLLYVFLCFGSGAGLLYGAAPLKCPAGIRLADRARSGG